MNTDPIWIRNTAANELHFSLALFAIRLFFGVLWNCSYSILWRHAFSAKKSACSALVLSILLICRGLEPAISRLKVDWSIPTSLVDTPFPNNLEIAGSIPLQIQIT